MDDALEPVDGVVAADEHGEVTMLDFAERVKTAHQSTSSTLVIGLAPRLDQLPYPIQQYDEPFLPYGRAIIEATHDIVCGYAFHLGAYLALGAAGAIALERTLAMVPASNLKLLHGPFVNVDYVRASYEDALNADAVTLATLDQAVITAYLQQPAHGVFVYTTNASESERNLLRAMQNEQVGSYQTAGEAYNTLILADATLPTLHWQWDKPILAARGYDFRDRVRTAALQARQAPTPP